MGVSVKEGETIKWNKDAFSKTEAGVLDRGITLNYWYNKDKIESFGIETRNPQTEAKYFSSFIGFLSLLFGILQPHVLLISILLFGLSFLSLFEKSNLAISVSVVYKNGNAVSSTAFYSDFNFLNVITIYGYGYGSWRNINIDYWRYHP